MYLKRFVIASVMAKGVITKAVKLFLAGHFISEIMCDNLHTRIYYTSCIAIRRNCNLLTLHLNLQRLYVDDVLLLRQWVSHYLPIRIS